MRDGATEARDDGPPPAARELVDRWGTHVTAAQTLRSEMTLWHGDDALVGYADADGHWVAAAQPIAAPDRLAAVAQRAADDALAAHRRLVFFSAPQHFVDALAAAGVRSDVLQIGVQPEWDPRAYHTRGGARRSLREQVNRAGNKGVVVAEVTAAVRAGGPVVADIRRLAARWLADRRMAEMGFLVRVDPLVDGARRRYLIARRDDEVVAALVLTPVPARVGWFFEHIFRTPDAPNGTVERIVDHAMRALAAEDVTYASMGLCPLVEVDAAPGRHRLTRSLMVLSRRHLGFVYNFDGLMRFKARFHPDACPPQYLIAIDHRITPFTVHAMLTAFSGGNVAFALETARQQVRRVPWRGIWAAMATMAGLLVPWTALLALADGARWFGSDAVRDRWVAFDVFMIGALSLWLWVGRRGPNDGTRRLGLSLAGLAMLDAFLTIRGVHGTGLELVGFQAVPVWAGLAAPLFATALLLVASRR